MMSVKHVPISGNVIETVIMTSSRRLPSAIDPERGPTASIPLHTGASKYYREREILK